jgi:murein DD-endopeptidase MepM/ murein hydrolase activator NlpD
MRRSWTGITIVFSIRYIAGLGKGVVGSGRRSFIAIKSAPRVKTPAGSKRTRFFLLFFAITVLAAFAAAQELYVPERIAPGDPLVCWLKSQEALVEGELVLKSEEGAVLAAAPAFFMPSGAAGYLYGFILAVPPGAKAGAARLRLAAQVREARDSINLNCLELDRDISIEPKSFAKEDIALDSANTAIRIAPDPAKDAQTEEFAKIFKTKDPTALFALDAMIKPLSDSWRITAGFADQRRYLYANGGVEASLHGGIDLGAASETSVRACAPGLVAFAGTRIVTGNTVVLEHLPGLFSIYMHLSSISVAKGDLLSAGQLLGKVGSTGLSTGPHLHWELRVGPQSVNPEYWLSRPILDKTWLSGGF